MIQPNRLSRMARNPHGHTWLVGIVGLAAGLILLIWAPTLAAASRSIILFAGFHLLGGVVIAMSAYVGWFRNRRRAGNLPDQKRLVFSTGASGLNAPLLIGLVVIAGAVVLQVTRPALWPLSFCLVASGAIFFVGSRVGRAFRTVQDAVLPLVDLSGGSAARVLDMGCGSGRSTVPFALGDRRVTMVALDDFAGEEDPALKLLRRNLQVAALEDRVKVLTGQLGPLPFADQSFDVVLSVNVLDHRGGERSRALAEIYRVLRPGGRLLLVVRTPSLAMFAVLHLLALGLTWPRTWRRLSEGAGLRLLTEGRFNNSWFAVLERPPTI